MPRFDACLYDLDGTLIDSIALIFTTYRHTLMQHHGEAPPDDVWLRGLGTTLREQLGPFAADVDELESMVATYRDFNFTHHDAMIRPFPGTRAAVQELKDRGVALGIVTSKMQYGLQRGLQVCGLDDLFTVLVAADDVGKHKPDPAPVQLALERLQIEPERALFVGDSPHDVVAGNAAGVTTAAVLWGPFPRRDLERVEPDHWLAQPSDIVKLVQDSKLHHRIRNEPIPPIVNRP
jgi:pyrophosphatase PpaX